MFDAEQWAEVERLFILGVQIPHQQRAEFLERECRDEALRREVASLLEHASEGLATANVAIAAVAAAIVGKPAENADTDPLAGTRLGPYRIDCLLGRGGMGAVYRAVRDDDQFRKQVAIKVIPRVLAGPDAVARFRSERQILANLEHPHIARLLDGGTSEGIPYLVMEYVQGVPITEYVRAKDLNIAERLRLMQSVCSAVMYAHQNLVVHRDLKPANILVTAEGSVKLLDFGIAKLTDPSVGDTTLTAHLMMTPEYASPEQIQGMPVTTASDVYSLGVVLYEVLTGERPYGVTTSSLHDLERAICQTEPRKPSSNGSLAPRTRRRLAGDLDNIVLKAMQKDASRRYGSVEQLAEDLGRHLRGLPVRARPDTWLYRGGKFLRRHGTAVAAALVVAASLVTGMVIAGREARAARERFDQLREFARTVLVEVHGQLTDIPGAAKARQALVAYVDDYLRRVASQHPGDDVALAGEFATTYLRLGEMQGSTPEAIASFEKGQRLLERRRQQAPLDTADTLLLARLRMRAGAVLLDLGRTPQAAESLNEAVRMANAVTQATGWSYEAQLVQAFAEDYLARHYRIEYRLQDAEQHARAAVALGEEMLRRGFKTKPVYESLTIGRDVLAGVLRRQGHWRASMEIYQQVLADTERLANAEPASVSLQRELARSHQIFSDTLVRVPGHDENEVRFHVRSAITIADRLAAADPSDKIAQSELAQYLSSGAEALNEPEEWEEGMGYLRRGLPILQNLLKAEPDNGTLRLYTALTEGDLGDFLSRRKFHQESIYWLRRGMSDMNQLVERDPKNTLQRLELVKLGRWTAVELARAGHARESLALARETISRALLVAGDAGGTPGSWRELPRSQATLAECYRLIGRPAESRRWYRVALGEWRKMKDVDLPDNQSEIEEARQGAALPSK